MFKTVKIDGAVVADDMTVATTIGAAEKVVVNVTFKSLYEFAEMLEIVPSPESNWCEAATIESMDCELS